MFHDTDLMDPAPPVPGTAERNKVAARATQIKRNRRFAAAGGALGVVAVLSLGAVALAGGGSDPTTNRVEVAGTSAVRDTVVTTVPAPTTVAPAPTVDTTPAPAEVTTNNDATPAPAPQEAPAPVATYTVSGTLSGYPSGVTGSVRLMGDGGTFTAAINADGSFSISGVPAGTYDASYSWQTTPDGAMQVGRTTITVNGDMAVTLG